MKRLFPYILSVILALGVMPAFALAEQGANAEPSQVSLVGASSSAGTQDAPTIPEARPEAVTGATAPEDEASREKVHVEDYREKVPAS